MRGRGRAVTLADVRVGASAVLLPDPALDAHQARRLVELGLRPGATVRVMMRTAGGGRVLGVDNLRIVLDRSVLGAIAVRGHRPVVPARNVPRPVPRTPGSPATGTDRPAQAPAPVQGAGDALPGSLGPDESRHRHGDRGAARRADPARRLRLLGGGPGLSVVPGPPIGDGTD